MNDFERAFEDCIDRLVSGESSVEECLRLYPQHSARLRPLLLASQKLASARKLTTPPEFRQASRHALVAHMKSNPHPHQPAFSRFLMHPARLAFAAVLALLVVLSLGTASAQAAMPGQPLYAWKLASEKVWRIAQPDPVKADVTILNRRADELVRTAPDQQVAPTAEQYYEQALQNVEKYDEPQDEQVVEDALQQQKKLFDAAGVPVPALDEHLKSHVPGTPNPNQPEDKPKNKPDKDAPGNDKPDKEPTPHGKPDDNHPEKKK